MSTQISTITGKLMTLGELQVASDIVRRSSIAKERPDEHDIQLAASCHCFSAIEAGMAADVDKRIVERIGKRVRRSFKRFLPKSTNDTK